MDDVSWNLMPHLKNCVTAFKKSEFSLQKKMLKTYGLNALKVLQKVPRSITRYFHSAVTYNDLQFDNLFLESG